MAGDSAGTPDFVCPTFHTADTAWAAQVLDDLACAPGRRPAAAGAAERRPARACTTSRTPACCAWRTSVPWPCCGRRSSPATPSGAAAGGGGTLVYVGRHRHRRRPPAPGARGARKGWPPSPSTLPGPGPAAPAPLAGCSVSGAAIRPGREGRQWLFVARLLLAQGRPRAGLARLWGGYLRPLRWPWPTPPAPTGPPAPRWRCCRTGGCASPGSRPAPAGDVPDWAGGVHALPRSGLDGGGGTPDRPPGATRRRGPTGAPTVARVVYLLPASGEDVRIAGSDGVAARGAGRAGAWRCARRGGPFSCASRMPFEPESEGYRTGVPRSVQGRGRPRRPGGECRACRRGRDCRRALARLRCWLYPAAASSWATSWPTPTSSWPTARPTPGSRRACAAGASRSGIPTCWGASRWPSPSTAGSPPSTGRPCSCSGPHSRLLPRRGPLRRPQRAGHVRPGPAVGGGRGWAALLAAGVYGQSLLVVGGAPPAQPGRGLLGPARPSCGCVQAHYATATARLAAPCWGVVVALTAAGQPPPAGPHRRAPGGLLRAATSCARAGAGPARCGALVPCSWPAGAGAGVAAVRLLPTLPLLGASARAGWAGLLRQPPWARSARWRCWPA